MRGGKNCGSEDEDTVRRLMLRGFVPMLERADARVGTGGGGGGGTSTEVLLHLW